MKGVKVKARGHCGSHANGVLARVLEEGLIRFLKLKSFLAKFHANHSCTVNMRGFSK